MADICVKAGKHVFQMIQEGTFSFDGVTTFVGPGAGPRWLIAAGFDLTFLKQEVLGAARPVHLVGTSAGALRFAAWAQPEYEKSYHALMDSYISMVFSRRDNRRSVMRSIAGLIDDYVEDDALPFALANRRYRLAIITARARNLVKSETALLQGVGLGATFLFNLIHPSLVNRFFQRVVFHNSAIPPSFCLDGAFRGRAVPLNQINFKHVLMATSAIPMVASGVRDIYGAETGVYRDGGLTDYQLNHQYAGSPDDIILFFNHQERIVPAWMDKHLFYRTPPARYLENILMIYPSVEFVEKLPGGKVPDRGDFRLYMKDPKGRMRNWRKAVAMTRHFGEEFLELAASGRLRRIVEKL